MTNELLVFAGVSPKKALIFGQAYDAEFAKRGITNKLEIAHFLAQILHESGMLKYQRELWGPTADQIKYERDEKKPWNDQQLAFRLGNFMLGDGHKFMGRGNIQRTGRYNYQELSDKTDIDFVGMPQLLEQPTYAVLSDLEYWESRDIGKIARGDDEGVTLVYKKRSFEAPVNTACVYVTAKINPGLRGLDERLRLLKILKKAIGVSIAGKR